MRFEILSVAQDDHRSDRLTGSQRTFKYNSYSGWERTHTVQELRVSIDVKYSIAIGFYEDMKLKNSINFDKVDIDGLIEYLKEVKTFISEEKMVAKLIGNKL